MDRFQRVHHRDSLLGDQQPRGQAALGLPDVRQGPVADHPGARSGGGGGGDDHVALPAGGDGRAVRDALPQRGPGDGRGRGESQRHLLRSGHQQRRRRDRGGVCAGLHGGEV